MGIFSGLFKSRDKPENRTAESAYTFYIGGTTAGKTVTERSAMQMTAVYSCVRILAEAGFKVQDMNFHDCSNFPTPLLTDKWESWVDDIGNTAAKYGVEFSQSHLHFYEHMTADAETAQWKELSLIHIS